METITQEVAAYNHLEQHLSSPVKGDKENPWLEIAGKYENDPYFDQMLEDIAKYRCEQDTELDEYYRQMEIAENKMETNKDDYPIS